ncbi:MAG TPA: type II toxin-antitoxin system HicB family antitoxin [Planctomycetota bacterium]|jgi:predicted RNase H-like HicB family nuclease
MNQYTAIFTKAEEGGWVAQCAEVPSAITEGDTLREARQNLKEAIRYMLKIEAKFALKQAPKNAKVVPIRVAV